MKHTREYEIAWQGLKPGPQTFVYEIDNGFMAEREVDDSFTNWDAKITLEFDKHENFFQLNFDIDGSVTVPCDRCGDDFELKLWDEFKLIIKLTGDDTENFSDDDDVVFIPRSETVLDISNWLYEFLMLSIPLQRIHPDNENGEPGCNTNALNLLQKLAEVREPAQNSIWKGLDAFKKEGKTTKIVRKIKNKN